MVILFPAPIEIEELDSVFCSRLLTNVDLTIIPVNLVDLKRLGRAIILDEEILVVVFKKLVRSEPLVVVRKSCEGRRALHLRMDLRCKVNDVLVRNKVGSRVVIGEEKLYWGVGTPLLFIKDLYVFDENG